jgi:ABC-type sugar transport system ATPase subunit
VPEDASAEALVEVVKTLGREVILYLMIDDQTLIGKVDSSIHIDPNTNLRFGSNMARCHFFMPPADRRSSEVIYLIITIRFTFE